MNNKLIKKYEFIVIPLIILMTITIVSTGFINHVYASHNSVKVNCKDLALALITWDQSIYLVDEDDIAENEHVLNEEGVEPDLYEDIVDEHLEDLLDKVQDKCNNLDNDIEEMLDEIDFDLP